MNIEKIRNTTQAELLHQERDLSDQLFRLKFQMKMGQTESLNKMRGLRKDIARIKTVIREREMGGEHAAAPAPTQEKPAAKRAQAKSAAHRAIPAKAAAKRVAGGKTAKKTEKK
jgi:large subunit ribosomal protein L29